MPWFLILESVTKDVLKSICKDDWVILGRSKAKNQKNNPIVLTAMLQSFGTRLRAINLSHYPIKWVKSTVLLGLDS